MQMLEMEKEGRVMKIYFRVRAALFEHTVCSGCPFPSPNLKALGSATQGHARDRDLRAALGNPQDMRHIRQTHSGRSAGVATRPERQAAPPHKFKLPRRLSPPSHGSADRRLHPESARMLSIYPDSHREAKPSNFYCLLSLE